MAGNSFSFEEGLGPTAERKPGFVPADRTSKRVRETLLDPEDFEPTATNVFGELPKDPQVLDVISRAAKEAGVPVEYGLALAQQESGYNPKAYNKEFGASGMFQYIPQTARDRGIDPFDPAASATAAMQDFAQQMKKGGVEWAIKHHFAGPDTKGHGKKTRQYLADVSKRAEDIRRLLGEGSTGGDEDTGSSDDTSKQTIGTFSFEDGLGARTAVATAPEETPEDNTSFLDILGSAAKRGAEIAQDKISGLFEHVQNRLLTDLGQIAADDPRYTPTKYAFDPFAEGRDIRSREEARKRGEDLPPPKPGFWANLENPVKLLTEDSLPANFIEMLGNAPAAERKQFLDARKVVMQENIVNNPEKFPAVSVQAAKQAIAQREQKQNPGIAEMWNDLKQAAKEDPGRFGAAFANALIADPEMLFAPEGLGFKVGAGIKRMTTGAEVASKVTKIADRVIDAGSTGAALNLGIEAASAASEGRSLTGEEALFAGGLGFAASGGIAGILAAGSNSLARISTRNVTADTLDAALRDVAKQELVTERIVNSTGKIGQAIKHQIEDITGVKFESDKDLRAYLDTTRKEWRKLFDERDLNGQYQAALADERIARRQTLSDEATERNATRMSEAAESQRISAETYYAEQAEARRARVAEDYEKALQARDAAAEGDQVAAAQAEDDLFNATKQINEEDIIYSAFENSNEVARAMNRATRRDTNLRTPKWQRGDIDPRILTRLGVGSLFAGTAYALAPEQKEATALAAGLAGLVVPGAGGRVAKLGRVLRETGAISPEGDIVGLVSDLVKQGKLKAEKSVDEAKAAEVRLVEQAKQGNQKAYQELYKENFPRIVRYAKKYLREAGPKLSIDAEDVAQEAFVKAFQNLDSFAGESSFSTWLHTITRNQGLMAIREAESLKGGGRFDIQSSELPDVRTAFGENYSRDIFDEGAGAEMMDSPEAQLIRQQTEQQLLKSVQKLSEQEQQVFLLNKIEHMEAKEIAAVTGLSADNVHKIIQRTTGKVLTDIERGLGARKVQAGEQLRATRQTGEIDPRLLQAGGMVALGAGAGFFLNEQNALLGASIGAGIGAALASRGRAGTTLLRQLVDKVDYTTGITSTRIMNKSKPLWRKAIEHERIVLRDIHKNMEAVDPFLIRLQKLPKETKDILSRSILTGKPEVTERILSAVNDSELIQGWKKVRSVLDSLGDQLVDLKRFGKKELDYFPRIVKDSEGLLKAIGREKGSYLEEIIKVADNKAIQARGTGLSDIEKSLIINKALKDDKNASQQPGFAKNRIVEEITPELQKFYATPTESLHSYIRSAVEDIQRAKFFGKDLQVVKKEGKEYTNVDTSIGALVNNLMNEGKLTGKDAEEVASLLKSRFINGERAPAEIIQASKNLSYSGLLGNPFSAATQLGDAIIQSYTQDIRSALSATVRSLTGRKIVNMREFGLADHIAEEFASTSKTAKMLNKIFKYSLFKGVDAFGKNVGLNAAVLRFSRLARTEGGVAQIAKRYGQALTPGELEQLVKDLRKGEPTDLVRSIAFAELSRTQPVTRLELPQAYLDHPNGRLLYQFKTFMLKQIDLVRRDAYNEIKSGKVATGLKNLTELGIVMGLAGTSTNLIKDFMLGKDIKLNGSDIPMNMLKTFGMTQYFLDHFFGVSKKEAKERRSEGDKEARTTKAAPIETTLKTFVPPYKMFDEIVRGDKKAIRYIPLVGPLLYEQQKQEKK